MKSTVKSGGFGSRPDVVGIVLYLYSEQGTAELNRVVHDFQDRKRRL